MSGHRGYAIGKTNLRKTISMLARILGHLEGYRPVSVPLGLRGDQAVSRSIVRNIIYHGNAWAWAFRGLLRASPGNSKLLCSPIARKHMQGHALSTFFEQFTAQLAVQSCRRLIITNVNDSAEIC